MNEIFKKRNKVLKEMEKQVADARKKEIDDVITQLKNLPNRQQVAEENYIKYGYDVLTADGNISLLDGDNFFTFGEEESEGIIFKLSCLFDNMNFQQNEYFMNSCYIRMKPSMFFDNIYYSRAICNFIFMILSFVLYGILYKMLCPINEFHGQKALVYFFSLLGFYYLIHLIIAITRIFLVKKYKKENDIHVSNK